MNENEWHERTNDRIAALTSSETVQNDRLDDIDDRLTELDEAINGNHRKGYDGLIKEVEDIERKLSMLTAIMSPDALGNGGLKNRLKSLEDWKQGVDRWSDTKWKFWTAVAVAAISSIGLILTNLNNIADGFKKFAPNSPVIAKPAKKVAKGKRLNLMTYKKCDPQTDPNYSEEACSDNRNTTAPKSSE